MIQRIQTVHLLIAAALLLTFLALAATWGEAVAPGVGAYGAYVAGAAYVLGGLAAALALVSVFLYKDRKRQRAVVRAAMGVDLLLVVVALGALVVRAMEGSAPLGAEDAVAGSVGLLPLVAYAFLGLASRGVRRDIELVRSMDRLR